MKIATEKKAKNGEKEQGGRKRGRKSDIALPPIYQSVSAYLCVYFPFPLIRGGWRVGVL